MFTSNNSIRSPCQFSSGSFLERCARGQGAKRATGTGLLVDRNVTWTRSTPSLTASRWIDVGSLQQNQGSLSRGLGPAGPLDRIPRPGRAMLDRRP